MRFSRLEDHASVLRSSRAKSGTPTSAVITPTGSSSGRTTVRETTSDSTRNDAADDEDQRQQRAVQRPGDRCGRRAAPPGPTKPMMPQVATLAAVSSAVQSVDHAARAMHVGAEVMGRLLAEREQVEASRAQRR